jgi:Uma2 family endonuclease
MATGVEPLLTAEEFGQLPDDGLLGELVRGRTVPLTIPTPRHGQICANILGVLFPPVEDRNLGHLICNKCGVVTERDPDTVRGADIAYYSFARLPPGPLPWRYPDVAPDLIFEVYWPEVRWREMRARVTEFLSAGVTTVCVLDPTTQAVHAYNNELADRIFTADQELTLPEVLADFRAPVRLFFE